MFSVYLFLITGVIIVSASSIIIKWTGDVPFAVIAFYRLFISSLILAAYRVFVSKRSIKSVRKFHWHYFLAGFFLAGHLISWIASLQLTTIANSIFLESTHPVFAILVSVIFLKEFPGKSILPAFLFAIVGMFLIVYADFGMDQTKLSGDILAILSAILLAFYLLIARLHKNEPDFIKYLVYVYGSAAFVCAVYLIAENAAFTGFSTLSWLMMILLALGPNLMGHSILNWASRKIEIYKVNLALLLEPVLATLSGMILISEFPDLYFYPGAFLILFSIGYVVYREKMKMK